MVRSAFPWIMGYDSPFSTASYVPSSNKRCCGSRACTCQLRTGSGRVLLKLTAASVFVMLKKGASKRDRSSSKKWPPFTFVYLVSRSPTTFCTRLAHRAVTTIIWMIERLIVPSRLRDRAPSLSAFRDHCPETFDTSSVFGSSKAHTNHSNWHDSIVVPYTSGAAGGL